MVLAIVKTILTISKHRIALAKAGRKLGVSWKRILKHDNSKFHPIEFMQYVAKFELRTNDPEKWANSWGHHCSLLKENNLITEEQITAASMPPSPSA